MKLSKMFGSSNSLPTLKNTGSGYTRTNGQLPVYDKDRYSIYEEPCEVRGLGCTLNRREFYNSALDLVNSNKGSKTAVFWRRLPEVISSGQLRILPISKIHRQEAMFEVITSEASFLRRLQILEEHFIAKLSHLLDFHEKRDLFEFVRPIRKTSERFLRDLDKRWISDVILFEICDIIHRHASNYFCTYVTYCKNQSCQERCLEQLKAKNPEFSETLKQLEAHPDAEYQSLQSLLILPVQRITRFPLLVEAIIKYYENGTEKHRICTMALGKLKQIASECNEMTNKTHKWEEMLTIGNKFEFRDERQIPLSNSSRWLVKKGEVKGYSMDFYKASDLRRLPLKYKDAKPFWLFLFNDLLVIATSNSNKDRYIVLNCCERNLVVVFDNVDVLPVKQRMNFRYGLQLSLLGSGKNGQREFFIHCLNTKEKQDWIESLSVKEHDNQGACAVCYEEWDCPQVKSIYQFEARHEDEISLYEDDVLNVLRENSDGWFLGVKTRDGTKGYFPGNYVEEIISSHSKAKKLRQGYRTLRQKKCSDMWAREAEDNKKSPFYIYNTTESSTA